jgi:uncharacterized protein YjaG (DUF416 family)
MKLKEVLTEAQTYNVHVINPKYDAGDGIEEVVVANSEEEAKEKAFKIYVQDFEDDETITASKLRRGVIFHVMLDDEGDY